jgi:hypothetical protein
MRSNHWSAVVNEFGFLSCKQIFVGILNISLLKTAPTCEKIQQNWCCGKKLSRVLGRTRAILVIQPATIPPLIVRVPPSRETPTLSPRPFCSGKVNTYKKDFMETIWISLRFEFCFFSQPHKLWSVSQNAEANRGQNFRLGRLPLVFYDYLDYFYLALTPLKVMVNECDSSNSLLEHHRGGRSWLGLRSPAIEHEKQWQPVEEMRQCLTNCDHVRPVTHISSVYTAGADQNKRPLFVHALPLVPFHQ